MKKNYNIIGMIISLIMFTGCITLTESQYRAEELQFLSLSDSVELIATGNVLMDIPLILNNAHFFPSSFMVRYDDKIMYIDPFIISGLPQAEIILITHDHPDHYSIDDINKISNSNTTIICPEPFAAKLSKKVKTSKIYGVTPDETVTVGNFTIKTFPAYNLNSVGFTGHPQKAGYLSYLIKTNDITIFHSGDSDVIPEWSDLEKITVALVPIDDGALTMSTTEAAEFINKISPEYAIPMHYTLYTDETQIFESLVNPTTEVVILDGLQK